MVQVIPLGDRRAASSDVREVLESFGGPDLRPDLCAYLGLSLGMAAVVEPARGVRHRSRRKGVGDFFGSRCYGHRLGPDHSAGPIVTFSAGSRLAWPGWGRNRR